MEGVGRLIEKRRPCVVCCRLFARDRDLILIKGELDFYYLCESEIWENLSCGFSFPECLSEEEIENKVKERIDFLSQNRKN